VSALWAPITGWRANVAMTRRPLHAVAEPAARLARFPFLLVLIGIFGIGMAGLLMLNTTLQNQAFESRTLNRQATELAYAEADLENQLDALAAPQELARQASAVGMRPNPYPVFLVLPTGKVVGEPTAVGGKEVPALIVKTRAQLAAEQAAKRARVEAKAAKKQAAAADTRRKAVERMEIDQAKPPEKKAGRTTETSTKKGSDNGGRQ
jgi:hypothetical protein